MDKVKLGRNFVLGLFLGWSGFRYAMVGEAR